MCSRAPATIYSQHRAPVTTAVSPCARLTLLPIYTVSNDHRLQWATNHNLPPKPQYTKPSNEHLPTQRPQPSFPSPIYSCISIASPVQEWSDIILLWLSLATCFSWVFLCSFDYTPKLSARGTPLDRHAECTAWWKFEGRADRLSWYEVELVGVRVESERWGECVRIEGHNMKLNIYAYS